MINNTVVVDGHVHTFIDDSAAEKVIKIFNKKYDINFTNPGLGSINDVQSNMKNSGIDYTIMANFAMPNMLDSLNNWTLSVSKKFHNLIPLVSFHPDLEKNMVEMMESYIEQGARGIKFHPMAQSFEPSDKRLNNLYKFCNDNRIPIVFHCGRVSNARLNQFADYASILPVIENYTDLPIILTHMADGNVTDVKNAARQYSNVYFDTSIVITGYKPLLDNNIPSWTDDSLVVDVINEVGSDRILFGSDYPWGNPIDDINRFFSLDLSAEQKSNILGLNSMKLFNIPEH